MKILKNRCVIQKKAAYRRLLWSHQGLNLGPPDYESGATNQLSYRTIFRFFWLIAASDFASSVGHYRKVTPFRLARLPCTKTKTNFKIVRLQNQFKIKFAMVSANIYICLWFGVVTEPHCKYNTFFD